MGGWVRGVEDVDFVLRSAYAMDNRDNCSTSAVFRDLRGGSVAAAGSSRMSTLELVADAGLKISNAKKHLLSYEIVLMAAIYIVPGSPVNNRRKQAMAETIAHKIWADGDEEKLKLWFVQEVCLVWCGLPPRVSIPTCAAVLGKSRSQTYKQRRLIELELEQCRRALLGKLQDPFEEAGYV